MVGGEQAHHDPRRAEPALRGVVIDHRLLDRMKLAAEGKIFDRDELRAIELAQKQNAGIERLVAKSAAFRPRQHDSARPAVALGATFLRPLRPSFLTQPVENSRTGENRSSATSPPRKRKRRALRGLAGLALDDIVAPRSTCMMELFGAKRKRAAD